MNSEYCHKLKETTDIPKTEYEGYLWMSDSQEPERIDGKYDFSKISINPFIAEGNLKARDGSVSISIRHVGNKLLIYQYDLDKISKISREQITERKYLAQRIVGIKSIKFITVWMTGENNLAKDFKTLKPIFQVFDGFE